MRNYTESALQRSVIGWCLLCASYKGKPLSDYLFHVPNNRRTRIEGAILKGLGVKAGVTDLVLPIRTQDFGSLYLELKVASRTLTDEQIAYHQLLIAAGQRTATAWSLDEASRHIFDYLRDVPEFTCRDTKLQRCSQI